MFDDLMLFDELINLFEEHGDLFVFLIELSGFFSVVVREVLIFFVERFILFHQVSEPQNLIVFIP